MKQYIVCLKYGNKYGPEYVNKLYNMVKRNTTIDYEFVCMTENISGLDPHITILPLETDNKIDIGWWYKINLFDPNFPLKGTLLFIDLDVITFNDLDKFFEYEPGEFVIIENFHKNHPCIMNSSCFRMESETYSHVYKEFLANRTNVMKRFTGDQDWMNHTIKDNKFWPLDWVRSYKWDMKGDASNPDTSIAVFHGRPNPHEINTPWSKEHWR
jgi:hypothetical protein